MEKVNKEVFKSLSEEILKAISILMYFTAASDQDISSEEKVKVEETMSNFGFDEKKIESIFYEFREGNGFQTLNKNIEQIKIENDKNLNKEILNLLHSIILLDGEENSEGAVFNVIKEELL